MMLIMQGTDDKKINFIVGRKYFVITLKTFADIYKFDVIFHDADLR